jgi:excisionase family DNA binding protein
MGAAAKNPEMGTTMIVTMTQDQLRELVGTAVREAIGQSSPAPDFLTMEQAAALMQVHERTIRNWVTKCGLPALRAGGEYRFRRESVIAWLDARAAQPGSHVSKHVERGKRVR